VSWSFTGEDYNQGLVPGSYVYTFSVTAGTKTETFTVEIVLIDPCANPTIIKPSDSTQVYVITDPDGKYTLQPAFEI